MFNYFIPLKVMDVTQIYAITAGAIFGLVLMIRAASSFVRFLRPYSVLLVKHFLYPNVLRRHRFFGPWTRAQVLLHLLYLAVNIFCSIFGVSSIRELGTRTGTLSLINIIPSYFGHHLSFASDMLGLSIINYQRIRTSNRALSVLLGLCHAVVNVASVTKSRLFSASGQLVGFIVKLRFFWK